MHGLSIATESGRKVKTLVLKGREKVELKYSGFTGGGLLNQEIRSKRNGGRKGSQPNR